MAIARFVQGTLMAIDQRQVILKRELDRNIWQIEDARTGKIEELAMSKLQSLFAVGKLVFVKDRDSEQPRLSESQAFIDKPELIGKPELLERAKIRLHYVKAIWDLPATPYRLIPALEEAAAALGKGVVPPHFTNAVKWKKRYKAAAKDIVALIDHRHKQGNRTRRFPQEVLALVMDAIEAHYMTRERRTVQDTLVYARKLVARENKLRPVALQLPLPSLSLINSTIKDIPAFDRDVARYGRQAATRKYRAVLGHQSTSHPLQYAEMDHTRLDIFVVDDDSHVPLGRPWVTVVLDSHTRCVLGIYISFTPPSYVTVARCLKHAFLPKVDLKEQYPSIKNEWLAHGVMDVLIVDNGLEFHGTALENACYSFGITLQYTPRKTPWLKGKVERFHGTLNRAVAHGVPGTTFSNIFEKEDYDPEAHAVITYSRMREILMKWIADVYHQKPHKGLDGITPAELWKSSIRDYEITLPDDPQKIDIFLGKPLTRSLGHKGIEWERLFYNSPELQMVRKRFGSELQVEVMVDEGNIEALYVTVPDGSGYVRVPAIKSDYAAGLSLWQHQLYRTYAVKHKRSDEIQDWEVAKDEITAIIQSEFHTKRRGRGNGRIARHEETRKQVAKPKKGTPDVKDQEVQDLNFSSLQVEDYPEFKPIVRSLTLDGGMSGSSS